MPPISTPNGARDAEDGANFYYKLWAPHPHPMTQVNPLPSALFSEIQEGEYYPSFKEKQQGDGKILFSIKISKIDVITLERPLSHFFEDLISEIILVLFPLELNKFKLEISYPE